MHRDRVRCCRAGDLHLDDAEVRPVPIPKDMGILGGETKTIRGGDTGAEDVECEAGHTPEGVPFFAYLLSLSADDLRALHHDPRMWVIQLGSQSLYPHAFTTAFVTPPYNDAITETMDELAELISRASVARLANDSEVLDDLLLAISSKASVTRIRLAAQLKEA